MEELAAPVQLEAWLAKAGNKCNNNTWEAIFHRLAESGLFTDTPEAKYEYAEVMLVEYFVAKKN